MIIDGYTRTESDNKFVSKTGNATISGNLDVGANLNTKRLIANRPNNDGGRYDYPLQVINNDIWWEVAKFQSTQAGDGCLIEWFIADDSSPWFSASGRVPAS